MNKKKLNSSSNWSKSGQGSRLNASSRVWSAEKASAEAKKNALDEKFGFALYEEAEEKLGWLLNLREITYSDAEQREVSAVALYFLQQDGETFKVITTYQPYFYIGVSSEGEKQYNEIISFLLRKFEGSIVHIEVVDREDLDMKNHLQANNRAQYLKIIFRNVSDLSMCKSELRPIIKKNVRLQKTREAYELVYQKDNETNNRHYQGHESIQEMLIDLREYDVVYYMRCCIDLDFRVGAWYSISNPVGTLKMAECVRQVEMLDKAEPVVFAFDIECTKAPLKFPDADKGDQIYMISYMVDTQGYLIINRQYVSEDIEDFEYTPKSNYPGPFIVFNEENEKQLLARFFNHIGEICPHIYVSYNGDFFDWPFIEKRAALYNMDLFMETGVSDLNGNGEYRGQFSVHMDAFYWVKRDSYLPQGSQGLKAVTKYKLGYDPVEVDPEEMQPLAMSNPMQMASYSVSDAVATYYLYEKYVHLFVFSLCTIIPMGSEDVLRKGSGTLCEALLMVEAYQNQIIAPNKQQQHTQDSFYKGHLIESETYIGGHVECLESGVFRSDLEYKFRLTPSAFDELIRHVDRDLTFALEVELDVSRSDVVNYDHVRSAIIEQLEDLRDMPQRNEKPKIYHLDVAAMYPNIILTNRLQPCAIVNEADCAACTYNTTENNQCKRQMDWVWRGDFYPARKNEYEAIKTQLEYEDQSISNWEEKQSEVKRRLKKYCSTVYKKVKVTQEEKRSATVCMRENPFYVDTVRAFRDRRYEYKIQTKKWYKKIREAEASGDAILSQEAANKAIVYDSLQLAHKCILNSFYGYVMRKGARWHSMEMAGIVTNTGSAIIQRARALVEQIGRPLELDTDGIWCILPASFPENFLFLMKDGTKKHISYPCVMLNADVHQSFTNSQYQEKKVYFKSPVDENEEEFRLRSECSIFFEVDGPYKCMVLPASTEEGKLLKKRYAVFNHDNTLAELKGFELKRRGELQLIKAFQGQVFNHFLDGKTLSECYESVGACAKEWLDIVDKKGVDMASEELLELISENRSMSRSLEEYGDQKSTAITTAKRLGQFLGADMVKEKGLQCKMIIANRPYGEKVTERAIPTAIFAAEMSVQKHFLRRWLKDPSCVDFNIRSILDWDYYRQRLGATILKIISLPAAFQQVANPIPQVPLPEWMQRLKQSDGHRQTSMHGFLKSTSSQDMEDMFTSKKADKKSTRMKMLMTNRTENEIAPVITNKSEVIRSVDEEIISEVEKEQSLESGNFKAWLLNRKSKWKRKRLKLTSDGNGKRHKSLVEQFRSNNIVNKMQYWQIVEVQELEHEPGLFQVWVLNSNTLDVEQLTIAVASKFYLNVHHELRENSSLAESRKVVRILPHNQPIVGHLYELSSLRNSDAILNTLQSDPNVTGIYETQISPTNRIIYNLGCVFQLKKSSLYQKKRNQVVPLEECEFANTTTCSYLNSTQVDKILLYYVQQGDLGLLGLFLPSVTKKQTKDSTYCGNGHVWVINKYAQLKRQPVDKPPNLTTIFSEIVGEQATNKTCELSSYLVHTKEEAFVSVDRMLAAYKDQLNFNKSTIVLCQSVVTSKTKMRSKMNRLHAFPLVMLPWYDEDQQQFTALTWVKTKVSRLLRRCLLEMGGYYTDLIDCARYAHVPIGNFTEDHVIAILDTLYSRLLIKNNHVLWTSPTNLPDLGYQRNCNNINSTQVEQNKRPAICLSGSYDDICIEFNIEGLAVNTILVAPQIHSIEGTTSVTEAQQPELDKFCGSGIEGGKNTIGSTDGDSDNVMSAFRILRSLLLNLFKDFLSSRNKFADHLLQHIYRWISSASSKLYDPALHQLILLLMHKLFLQLLAEFKRLGATIIYADFNRVILSTKKTNLKSAQSYFSFISQTILSNDLFQVLNFTPTRFISNLLLMDSENYGGILINTCEEDEETLMEEDNSSKIISHWNIANYLPEGVNEYFLVLVGQFVKRRAGFILRKSQNKKVSNFEEELGTYSKKMVLSYFNTKLLRILPEIMAANYKQHQFPVLAGSHLTFTNPALELLKSFCHVLQFQSSIREEVLQLKRGLLKIMNVSEFSDEAVFRNPSVSFILPDVFCLNCNYCRNIDLCRDPEILALQQQHPGEIEAETNENDQQLKNSKSWHCIRCHAAYDKAVLELRLVEMVQAESLYYQTQDVYCRKCRLPAEKKMKLYCTCSGTYHLSDHPQSRIQETLRILANIAHHHEFSWLQETVERLQE